MGDGQKKFDKYTRVEGGIGRRRTAQDNRKEIAHNPANEASDGESKVYSEFGRYTDALWVDGLCYVEVISIN